MWVAYYSDGETYSGDPENSPAWGIVAVAQEEYLTGQKVEHGDILMHIRGRWIGVDQRGADDLLTHYGHTLRAYRVGRRLHHDEWSRIYTAALNDPRVPPRSAHHPKEPV